MFNHTEANKAYQALQKQEKGISGLEGLVQAALEKNDGKETEAIKNLNKLIKELRNVAKCLTAMLDEHAKLATTVLRHGDMLNKHVLKKKGEWRGELLTESLEAMNEDSKDFMETHQQLFKNYIKTKKK